MKRNTMILVAIATMIAQQGTFVAYAKTSENVSLNDIKAENGVTEQENIDFDITGEETRKLQEIKIEPGKKVKITNNSDNKGMVKTKDAEFSEMVEGQIHSIKTRTDGLLEGKSTLIVGNDSKETITVYMLEDFGKNCTVEEYENRDTNIDDIDFDITGEETRKLQEIKIEPGKKVKITNNSDNKGMVKTKDAEFSEMVEGQIYSIKTRTDGLLEGKSTLIVGNDSKETITVYMLEDFGKNCTVEEYENRDTNIDDIDFDITGQETRKLQEIKIEPGKKVKITNNSENKGMVKTKDAEFSEMVEGQIHSIKTRTDGLLEGKSTLIVGNDSKETITVYMLEDFGKNCTVEEYENRDTNIDDIDFDITGEETRKLQEIKIEPGKKVKIINNSDNKGMVKTKDAEFSEMVEGQIHSIKTRTDGLLEGKSTLIVGNDSKETITVYMLEDFGKNCTVEEYENRDTNIDDIDFDITGQETRKLQEIKIEPGKKVKITNNSENKGMVKTKDAEFSEMVEGQIHSIKTRTDGLLEGKSTLIVGNDSKETITVYMLEDFGKNCTVEEYENRDTNIDDIDFDITGEETRKLQEIKIEPGKKVKITNNSENKGMVKTKDAEFSEMVEGQIHSIKTRTDGLLEGKSTLIVGNDSKETITVYMLEDFGKNCTVEEYTNEENKPSQGNKDNKPIEDDKPNESNENKQNEDNKLNENDKLSENDQGDLISCGDVNSGLFASLALIVSGAMFKINIKRKKN